MSNDTDLNQDMQEPIKEELQPSLPKKSVYSKIPIKWKWALLVSFVFSLMLFAWFSLREVRVNNIEVDGQVFTSVSQIKDIAKSQIGIHADSIETIALIEQLEKLDFVKSASVYVEAGGTLKVLIKERNPVAYLVDHQIQAMLDEEGKELPFSSQMVDLPLLHGVSGKLLKKKTAADSASIAIIVDFLTEVKNDPFTNATISEVVYEPGSGMVALSNDNGVKIHFGMKNFHQKLQNWKAFHQQVIKYKGLDAFAEVDLRFTNQIITREV